MIIEPVIIEDKQNVQIAMLRADSRVLSAKGGDGTITLNVKQNPRETRHVESAFQVLRNNEEATCVPGDYIASVEMGDGSVRHIFGSLVPTFSHGGFCYIDALTQKSAVRAGC
ncbi:MAG: hypothetical protein ACLQF0_06885 [Dissulfurispiraceae bacterium]